MRKLWYRFTVATMYFSAGLIPTYLNLRMLGFMNNFLVYIIPGMISVYNMVLIKTYIESLPAELEESAEIDGAGYIRRFVSIVLPLSVPIIATVSLFTAVSQWNSFMDCLLYITKPQLYTLQYILQMYFRQAQQLAQQLEMGGDSAFQATPKGIQMTITMVITIPHHLRVSFCAAVFCQRDHGGRDQGVTGLRGRIMKEFRLTPEDGSTACGRLCRS